MTLLAVAACGGSPTATTTSKAGGGGGSTSLTAQRAKMLDDVYAQIKGLTGEQREQKLAELAKKEQSNGDFTIYYGIDEAEDWIKAFEKKYDLQVKSINLSSRDELLRIVQESKANYKNASDIVMSNQLEMTQMANQYKLFLPLKTPTTANVPKDVVWDNRAAFLENWFAVTWNPKELSAAEAPKTWNDVLTKYSGKMIMETTDWAWFATLVEKYFVGQKGMTEDAAVKLFEQAAHGSAGIAGHTLMTQLVGQGEYAITPDAYQQRVTQLVRDDGMPLSWEPPVQPIISRVDEIAINNLCDRPATALLWIDYVFTDVQTSEMPKQDLVPITTDASQSQAKYDLIHEDGDQLVAQQDKWTKLYNEVIKQIGKVVEPKK